MAQGILISIREPSVKLEKYQIINFVVVSPKDPLHHSPISMPN